ncbi:MAG: amino acid-binding protein [Gammaproteobacteria bacterium]|nr:amino acid-binding protein [Gammaproteobacteria bacterium]
MHWYMLTLIGKDRPRIVAQITAALFEGGCNLGEASMLRLGGNFAVMLMVKFAGSKATLTHLITAVAESMELHLHIDSIDAKLHQHMLPDVSISVYGADRAGIVAKVTGVLAEAGLHILDLESDVAGTETSPIYVMHIEGKAQQGIPNLESALDSIRQQGIEVRLTPIDTLVG